MSLKHSSLSTKFAHNNHCTSSPNLPTQIQSKIDLSINEEPIKNAHTKSDGIHQTYCGQNKCSSCSAVPGSPSHITSQSHSTSNAQFHKSYRDQPTNCNSSSRTSEYTSCMQNDQFQYNKIVPGPSQCKCCYFPFNYDHNQIECCQQSYFCHL